MEEYKPSRFLIKKQQAANSIFSSEGDSNNYEEKRFMPNVSNTPLVSQEFLEKAIQNEHLLKKKENIQEESKPVMSLENNKKEFKKKNKVEEDLPKAQVEIQFGGIVNQENKNFSKVDEIYIDNDVYLEPSVLKAKKVDKPSFKEAIEKNEPFIIQLPSDLPLYTQEIGNEKLNGEEKIPENISELRNFYLSKKYDTAGNPLAAKTILPPYNENISAYKIGKVKITSDSNGILEMGENDFKIENGIDSNFYQQIASIDQVFNKIKINFHGRVNNRFKVSSNFD